MTRFLKILLATAFLLAAFRFWFGVYSHDEFGGTHLFVKHRPVWKWHFYSPIGMTDMEFEDLTAQEKEEQLMFNEFVSDRGMSR